MDYHKHFFGKVNKILRPPNAVHENIIIGPGSPSVKEEGAAQFHFLIVHF